MKKLYVTSFNAVTKKCNGPSTLLPTKDIKEAQALLGGRPDACTKNMSFYFHAHDQGVCLSWIRFAL